MDLRAPELWDESVAAVASSDIALYPASERGLLAAFEHFLSERAAENDLRFIDAELDVAPNAFARFDEASCDNIRNLLDEQAMLGHGEGRVPRRLTIPAGDTSQSMGNILDLDIDWCRIKQVKPPARQHTLPSPVSPAICARRFFWLWSRHAPLKRSEP